ncbi:hypothetical protein QBC44DRAFT_88585 [Cladorrhinum sp. PSN332]|nr:hypothetical protein QBC44DRAFT_88585 [Cladorrhinum sp. PSN332]
MKTTLAALITFAVRAAAHEGEHHHEKPTFSLGPPGLTLTRPYPFPGKWTTSTVYTTSTATITSCPPKWTDCPAHSTVLTTVTIPVSTTVCPVTETTEAPPPPPPPTSVAPPPPPPSSSTYTPTKSHAPPPPPPPPPPPSSIIIPPPVTTATPTVTPTPTTSKSFGTITQPSKTSTTGQAVVTAGAEKNIQRAGGALAVIAVAAALL